MTTRRVTANDDSILKSIKHVFNITGLIPDESKDTKSHKKGKSDETIKSLKNEKFYTESVKRLYPSIDANTISKKVLRILNGSNQFNRSFDTFGKNLSGPITKKISNYNKSHNFNYNDYGSVTSNLNRHVVNIINNVFSEMNSDDITLRNYRQKLIYDILQNSDKTTVNGDIEDIKDKFKTLLKDIIEKRKNSTLGQYIEYLISNINKEYELDYPNIDDVETSIERLIENSKFDRENPDIKNLNEKIHTMIEEIRNNPTTDIKGNDNSLIRLTKYIEKSDEINNFVNELNQRLDNSDLLKYYDNSSDKLKIANNPIDVKDFTDRVIKIINEISQDDDIRDLKQSLINSVNEIYQNDINNDISTVKKSVINRVDGFNSDNNNIKDFQTKIIERINSDNFIVKNNPVENYKQEVVYSLINPYEKDNNIKRINNILTNIENIVNSEEYDDSSIESLNTEMSKLSDYSDSINQDENTKKRFNEVNQKITECIEAATNNDNLNRHSKIYLEIITDNLKDIVSKTTESSGDLEYIPSIDMDELTEKIIEEGSSEKVKTSDNKLNMISNIIANGLNDVVDDVRIDKFRDIAKDILTNIEAKNIKENAPNIARKTANILSHNVANRMYDTDEFSNSFILAQSNKLYDRALTDAVSKHMDFLQQLEYNHSDNEEDEPLLEGMIQQTLRRHRGRRDRSYEMLPPEQQADIQLREALDKQENPTFKENILSDNIKQPSQTVSEQPSQNESPRQLSTEVSDNDINKYEEDEHQDDRNTSNEMSEISETMITDVITPLSERIAEGQPSETETQTISLQDVVNDRKQIPSDDSNPPLEQPELPPEAIQADSTGVQLMPQNPNDSGRINLLFDALNRTIQMLQYSQSSTDTNNLLGGIVSIFKELPNIGDDEIANKLSEAVGPDGKKLFESKEEAARFIAKMRALNGNRLSSIKGGGSGQKTGIQLNITNKVVSNMPRKPFIVDTHPIPYQY